MTFVLPLQRSIGSQRSKGTRRQFAWMFPKISSSSFRFLCFPRHPRLPPSPKNCCTELPWAMTAWLDFQKLLWEQSTATRTPIFHQAGVGFNTWCSSIPGPRRSLFGTRCWSRWGYCQKILELDEALRSYYAPASLLSRLSTNPCPRRTDFRITACRARRR